MNQPRLRLPVLGPEELKQIVGGNHQRDRWYYDDYYYDDYRYGRRGYRRGRYGRRRSSYCY